MASNVIGAERKPIPAIMSFQWQEAEPMIPRTLWLLVNDATSAVKIDYPRRWI
jgi:hypothetical protein